MRYCGLIGFGTTVSEDGDDVYKEEIECRPYMGDVVRHTYNMQSSDKLTKDVQVNMQVSILADEFATNFMHLIRFAEWRGVKWQVTAVEPQYPRLILSLGGVYNG